MISVFHTLPDRNKKAKASLAEACGSSVYEALGGGLSDYLSWPQSGFFVLNAGGT
jgi:hypothetical protein